MIFKINRRPFFILIALVLTSSLTAQWEQQGINIMGEGHTDKFGFDVDMNGDGTIIVASAPDNDANGTRSGNARVYQWNGGSWTQMGMSIEGLDSLHRLASVALDLSGNTLAVGDSPFGFSGQFGKVRVLDWDGAAWIQRGEQINGTIGDGFAYDIALSNDGNILAVSAPNTATANGDNSGRVSVYEWMGAEWTPRGLPMDGEAETDFSGRSISLSADGSTLVIGAPGNDAVDNQSGHVRVYDWDGATWSQRGMDVDGLSNLARFGTAVYLTADGNRLAVGSPGRDVLAVDGGEATVFDWDGSAWQQIGQALHGPADLDNFGEALSLSADGNTLAVGAHEYTESTGSVRIYELSGATWTQTGDDLIAINNSDRFGDAVALNSDGSSLVVGATDALNDDSLNTGFVRVLKQTIVSIDEFNALEVNCFPNPTNEQLTINSLEQMNIVSLFDATGHEVRHFSDCGTNFTLDVSDLESGIYLLQVTSNEDKRTVSVIKS